MNLAAGVARDAWRSTFGKARKRTVAEEVAISGVHDGATQALMMATPADQELALGFINVDAIGDRPQRKSSHDLRRAALPAK